MKRLALLAVLIFSCLCGSFVVFAATGFYGVDYYIENYDVQITVGSNAVHHIVETIDVYFQGPHHGIVREIPLDYRDYDEKTIAKISNLACNTKYQSERDSGYLVMQIGSADKTVIGDVRYTISYDYDLGADFNQDFDLFYLNIIGTEWECPIKNATFSISIPYVQNAAYNGVSGFFDYVYQNTHFSSGSYGYQGGSVKATLRAVDGTGSSGQAGLIIEGSVANLGPYQGVTIKIDLPENWYSGARMPWDYTGIMRIVSPIACILIVALSAVLWVRFGRDDIPIVVAKFKAPDGLSPLMVGYVADNNVDDKDVISMIFYWADLGLLSINEKKDDVFEFTKLKDIEAYEVESGRAVPSLEKDLFNGFFKGCKVNDVIKFKDLQKNNFYFVIQTIKSETKRYFTKDKALLDRKSIRISGLMVFLAFLTLILGGLRIGLRQNVEPMGLGMYIMYIAFAILLIVANIAAFQGLFNKWYLRRNNVVVSILTLIPSIIAFFGLGAAESVANNLTYGFQVLITVISCTLTCFFSVITTKRSAYGTKVLEDILGYREFIDKVEIDKLKIMIDQDPDLYYRVLSYAIVLGLEDKWAHKFDGMIVNPPLWYSGYGVFDVYCMTRLASRMNRSIVVASMPKNSGGSPGSRVGGVNFGGGGFSGGGFGGGGGHAW